MYLNRTFVECAAQCILQCEVKKQTNVVKNKIVQEANNNNEINNTDRKKCKSSIQKFIVIL